MQRRLAYQHLRKQLSTDGIPSPQFEAKQLLGFVLGESANGVLLSEEALTEAQEEHLGALAEKRGSGYPLQYLLGEWSFFSHSFFVGEGVLIPRADTEVLCETALEWVARRRGASPLRVLDLCSGTGCIAITLAREVPGSDVVALEQSPTAIHYLKKNIARHHSAVTVLQEDALAPETALSGAVDLITCNPPYLSAEEMAHLQREVSHEPRMALAGGADGYDFYRALLPLWTKRLTPGGMLLFEVGVGQHQTVTALMAEHGLTNLHTKRDLGGVDRVVSGIRPEHADSSMD